MSWKQDHTWEVRIGCLKDVLFLARSTMWIQTTTISTIGWRIPGQFFAITRIAELSLKFMIKIPKWGIYDMIGKYWKGILVFL